MVKSIEFDSVGKSSFGHGLDNSDGIELSSSKRLNYGFSNSEEVLQWHFPCWFHSNAQKSKIDHYQLE